MNVLDEQVVHRTVGRTVMLAQEQFGPYVAKRRANEEHPSLYLELERLANRLRTCELAGQHVV
ncbi:DUF4760 domain-containing protein [Dactylosporangium darangshiense]|uniref:Uncharacterized protein n=1 Tax=Dactylosporangium darangshiense TaxID=579108 RepID=A0ABP8DWG7_9ACTN